MSLPRRQRRLLQRIEDAQSWSDPGLARMMAGFCLLTADEPMPGHEALRSLADRIRAVLLIAVTAMVAVVVRAGVRLARASGAVKLFQAARLDRRRRASGRRLIWVTRNFPLGPPAHGRTGRRRDDM